MLKESKGGTKKGLTIVMYFLAGFLLLCVILLISQVRLDIPLDKLTKDYANEHSKFIEVDGTNVHYRDEGEGDTLVLIHGWASSLHTWEGWTNILKSNYRIIRLDLPAFGLTGPGNTEEHSKDYYVDFLAEFLNKLEIKKAHIAGNSLGGSITASFALRYPEMTDKIILLNAAGYITDRPDSFAFISPRLISFMARHITPRYIIRTMIKDVYGDESKLTEETVIRYQQLLLREGNREVLFRVLDERDISMIKSEREELNKTAIIALIMWGDMDKWVPPQHAYLYKEDIPNSRLIMYKGVGHIPMEEIPLESAQDARDFLMEREEEADYEESEDFFPSS